MARKKAKIIREPLWYKDAVIYELHIKAFRDQNGDGIGDFKGLFEKLDYIENLGVTAIWLLPFFPSPLRDDGYDIADYMQIHDAYGDLSDFKLFLKEAHKRNLKVIIELVMNHTSDQHSWFQRARRAPKGSPERAYYIWSDTPDKFKDARIIFTDYESSNWTWDPIARQYFWHRFFNHQPDLNYDNPRVQREIFKIIDHWLKMGVDGFRLDAIPYLFERDDTNCENLPETHVFLKKLRKYIDDRYEHVLLLAEANMWPEDSASYFGDGDECHMNYHFPLMPRMFMAVNMENRYPIMDIIDQTPEIPETCQWATFLRNHDELTLEMVTEEERDYMYKVFTKDPLARINLGIRKRLAPLLDNDRRKIELMNVLLFSLPGTPVIYYGDEIGMGDNYYLGDRNGVRTPMQWDPGRNAGFSEANPQKLYLPLIIDPEYTFETVNVENQLKNSNSLLWWTRRLVKMWRRFKAFGRGTITFLESENPKTLLFTRHFGDEQILVAINLSRYAQSTMVEMQQYKGLTPVEVFSQNHFPKVGDEASVFTFAPYGYYWFLLVKEEEETAEYPIPMLRDDKGVINIAQWSGLWDLHNLEILEQQVLFNYMHTLPWFNPFNRKVESIKLFDLLPIRSRKYQFQGATLIIQVDFFEGIYEKYRLVVSFMPGVGEKNKGKNLTSGIISNMVMNGKDGYMYDALHHPMFLKTLVHLLKNNKGTEARDGNIHFDLTPELEQLFEEHAFDENFKLLESKAPHVTVQYAKKLIIKQYRKIDRGTDRDVEIIQYLSREKGFAHVPKYLGAIQYSRAGDITRTLGLILENIPKYGTAWNYMSDALNRFYERVSVQDHAFNYRALHGSVTDPMGFLELDQQTQELLGGAYIEHIELLAQRTAEMHLALGTDNNHPDFIGEDLSLHYQRSLFSALKSLERSALEILGNRAETFPKNHRREIQILLKNRNLLLKTLKRIFDHKIDADKIRPHGNYNLHAILFCDGDFIISHFEGDFSFSLTERRLRKSPIVDVATLLASFHDVAYSALFQNEPSGDLAEFWFHYVAQVFVSRYYELVKASPFIPAKSDFNILLVTFLLEKYLSQIEILGKDKDASRMIIPVRGISKLLNISDWLEV
jgi:maltose alpha-D-glucosyltransferase/alpha-amylase